MAPRLRYLQKMGVRFLSVLLVASWAKVASGQQATLRYLDLPEGAQPQSVVADASGNLFIVANIVEPSGRPQIRVLKTDLQARTLASFDFGGSSLAHDTIAGAAVDAQGNLVIAGSTSSVDFPLVSPLIS